MLLLGVVREAGATNYNKNVQAKLSEVIRSKLFLHEYENTHNAEQALPACRGAGRSSRGTRPLLSSSDGARSCRIRLRCLLLYC